MANPSDGPRWRRSFSDMVSLGGAAIAPLRRELAALLSALSDNAQAAFARQFGFSVRTVQQWEQGRAVPDRPARILLRVIETNPQAVEHALATGTRRN